jgi:hypothetical protein
VLRLRDIEGSAGLGRGGVELLAETRKLHDDMPGWPRPRRPLRSSRAAAC